MWLSVLPNTDTDAGIARVAAGATALPFSLRFFAYPGVTSVERPPKTLYFTRGEVVFAQSAHQRFHLWQSKKQEPRPDDPLER